ncbi:hypothetical protein D3C79_742070 [compost metagenome]
MFVDLVEAQQVDHAVALHGVGGGRRLPGTIIHVLHANPQPQPFGQAILELVGVQQAEAVARDVGQARAGGKGVVLGHFCIDIGITTNNPPLWGQVARDVDVQAPTAYLASRYLEGAGRVVRIVGQHVLLDDVVDRRVDAQLAVQRFPFHTQFIGLAFFRVEAATGRGGSAVGLERTGGVGIDRDSVGHVVDQAEARGYSVFSFAEIPGVDKFVIIVMFEALEPNTGQGLQALGEGHLVLDEVCPGLQVLFIPGSGTRVQRWTWLAQYRVEDVDQVGRCRALDDRVVIVVLVLDAGQQGMGKS